MNTMGEILTRKEQRVLEAAYAHAQAIKTAHTNPTHYHETISELMIAAAALTEESNA